MSTTSKSPRKVLLVAYHVGKECLRPYAHRCSPRKFTQPQLFACLVLKEFLNLDYRGLAGLLADTPELCRAIGLETVPHFTTFQKAARRLLRCERFKRMLGQTVGLAIAGKLMKHRVKLAAMDGTGLESHHASSYYVKRRAHGGKTWQKTTYIRFPKVGMVCDCASHMILAVVPGRGPGPDITHFKQALDQALQHVRINDLLADAGYDSERSHVYARQHRHVRTHIPALAGRPTRKLPTGRYRRMMRQRLNKTKYGQRWQIETVNSMLKRLLGSALRARTYWSQCREISLRALSLNIMILLRICTEVFYRAGRPRFMATGCICGPRG